MANTAQTSKLRRRLTVGVDAPTDGASGGGSGASNVDAQTLIKVLKEEDLMKMIADKDGGTGRRASLNLSTTTDRNLKRRQSYDDKDETVQGAANKDAAREELKKGGIGLCCKKGLKPESPNQDSFSVLSTAKFNLFGVFDGHGPKGHDVSNFVVNNLFKIFLIEMGKDESKPEAALEFAFVNTQKMLEHMTQTGELDATMSGSTCTVVYQPLDKKQITVAHAGDSRSILIDPTRKKSQDLTEDHKPDLPNERTRIEKAGGRVVFDGYFNHRVFTKDGRGGLNMSRALGDTVAHKAGVTAQPETKTLDIQGTEVLVICTDGVWEFISSEDAADIVLKYAKDDAQKAAEDLAKKSWDKWIEDSEGEVSDDITAIIVWCSAQYA